LVAGEHVPDRLGESAGEVDLGDLGAALLAEPGLGALVAVAVGGMGAGVGGGLDERPAQVAGTLFGERAAAVGLTGLVDARAEAVKGVKTPTEGWSVVLCGSGGGISGRRRVTSAVPGGRHWASSAFHRLTRARIPETAERRKRQSAGRAVARAGRIARCCSPSPILASPLF
jgi:hypothetical protein